MLLRPLQSLQHQFQQLKNRPDSEHDQAKLRLIIGFVILAYVFSPLYSTDYGAALDWVQRVMVLFAGFSVVIYLSILFFQGEAPVRRLIGMAGDLGATSLILSTGGEGATPLIAVYLWVTIGNGFRYGIPYLYASAAISCMGFTLVLLFGDFWASHHRFGITVMVLLVVIPLYMGSLLKKLRLAIQRANEANQAKSQFLANMSHELRTPLNGVIGLSDLLMETPVDKNQKDLTQSIQTSAHSLLHVVNDILDLTKIEAGKIEKEDVEWDLHQLVSDLKRMFHHPARRKGLQLITRIDPEIPFQLRGDAQHLMQLLVNLIGNAIKFTDEGHVELRIKKQTRSDARNTSLTLLFEIEDTGIGIPEKSQEAIFETFCQADASMTRRYGGTGLGTSIAKQLAELMSGKIGVRSTVGVGSTFWVSIPFDIVECNREDNEATQKLEGTRVLLLTSVQLKASLSNALDLWGVSWESTDTEENALARLRNPQGGHFDCVLVEREFLHNQADALAVTLKKEQQLNPLHLVLLDAQRSEEEEQALLQAGYATIVHTPLNRAWLFNALHEASSQLDTSGNVVSLADHYQRRGGANQLRVLVADDNEINRKVISGILTQAGHQVIAAGNGEDALDLLLDDEQAISLAILDMNMPDLGGIDVLKGYHFAVTPDQHIPIGVLTADATDQARKLCAEAGASFYLSKPVNARQLLDTVADQLPSDVATDSIETYSPKPLILETTKLNDLAEIAGNQDFLYQLVSSFDKQSRQLVEQLREAVIQKDYPLMCSHAHALRGNAAELGATAVADLCNAIESTKPPEMAGPHPRQLVDELDDLFDQTVTALRQHMADTPIKH